MAKAKTDNRRGVHLSVRVAADVHEALIRRASLNQQSVTNTVDRLLQQALHTGSLLGQVFDLSYRDPQLVAVLMTMGEAMRDTLIASKAEPGWVNDPSAFEEIASAAHDILNAYRPVGDTMAPSWGRAMADRTIRRIIDYPPGSPGTLDGVRERLDAATVDRLRKWQRNNGEGDRICPAPKEINQ
jgi:hypothetical protein